MKNRYVFGISFMTVVVIMVAYLIFLQWSKSNKYSNLRDLSSEQLSLLSAKDDHALGKIDLAHIESKQVAPDSPAPPNLPQKAKKNLLPLEKENSWDELPLPQAFTDAQINQLMREAVWKSQDAIMRKWPTYSEVHDKLAEDVAIEYDLKNMSVQELKRTAIMFQQKFWQAGGSSSPESYQHAYTARLLLELAHSRNPENLIVIDELVETIQAAHPVFTFDEKTNKKVRNIEGDKTLFELRAKQYNQISEKVQAGHNPSTKDFIRVVDLAIILSIYNPAKAKEVVDWLQENAQRGGWDKFNERLADFQGYLSQEISYAFDIYIYPRNRRDENIRYERRYPSFRGPSPEKRGVLLWGWED
jgi:hypothetical protein